MVNGWKVTAIIFIILCVLESAFILWAWNMGSKSIENEYECGINICSDAEAYQYDDYEGICYCYVDGEIVSQEYMG